jgi:high affinity Mn2+ porin
MSGGSSSNQKFLELGGMGILAGDGALTYGSEKVMETYYDFPIWRTVHRAVDYQFIVIRHSIAIAARCQSFGGKTPLGTLRSNGHHPAGHSL